jgi:hypothetical protein
MNKFLSYLLHGAPQLRKLGSVYGEPLVAGRVRLHVYIGTSTLKREPRLHLEIVFTSILSYSATPFQLDPDGAQRLLTALSNGDDVSLRGEPLQLLGRQELHVEPLAGGQPPRLVKLTFLYWASIFASEWRTIELDADAIGYLISLLEQARAELGPGAPAA